ncbi:MAG: hypothetical protein R2762_24375 [Bryobacteraceae bacterium]
MRLLSAVLVVAALRAQDPGEVMRRMAENVERGAAERVRWVYEQKVRASLVRSSGEISRWEKREYAVTPGAEKTEKELTAFEGEYRQGRKMYPYTEPGHKYKDSDIDGELIDDLVKDLVNDKKSRDGIPHSLFPLRTKDLALYRFAAAGEGEHEGRRFWKIAFEPAEKRGLFVDSDEDGPVRPWKGEAWVDAEEYQPVRIVTDLAYKIPWAVRTFLGTNLQQTGFSVTYQRVAPNVWFPVSYGTEFKVSVVFFYKRTIALGMESTDFRRAEANSRIEFDLVP